MDEKQSPICEICSAWMLERPECPGWLKCVSCGFCKRIIKTQVTPIGKRTDD